MSQGEMRAGSGVFRFHDFQWEGVESRKYKEAGDHFRGVVRRMLAQDDALAFEVRYFEVEPGGYTSFERHEHEHVVIVMRGKGSVRLGEETRSLGFGDLVRVAPRTPHRFSNTDAAEPFGFLCIVDRERDRPEPVAEHNRSEAKVSEGEGRGVGGGEEGRGMGATDMERS